MDPDDMNCMELIKFLDEGDMLNHPAIRHLTDRALRTGDCESLRTFLKAHRELVTEAENNIRQKEFMKMHNPFVYPTSDDVKESLSGPLKLGYVNLCHDMFGIIYNVLVLPTIIMGRMGGGKSRFLYYLLTQIFRKTRKFNVIIPDLKGNEYRQLLPFCKHLKIITNKIFGLNLLRAPCWMDPMDYIIFFSKVFTKSNYLASTSEAILIKNISYLYKKRGIFDGSQNWPTIKDLHNLVSYNAGKKKLYRYREVLELILNRLDPYIYSGKFDYVVGISDEIWRTENIVLEMGKGFTDNMYEFMVSYLAGLRYHYNMDRGLIGSKLRTLLIVDEGRLLFRKREVALYGESFVQELSTRFREPGLGLVLASHETESFSQTIKATSFTKICFPLTDGADKAAVKESFGLDDDQAEYLFKLPQFGQAIVRYGGFKDPFLLGVPHLKPKKYVTDEEVERRMAEFYTDLEARMKKKSVQKPLEVKQRMPAGAAALLHFLGKHPFTKVSEMTNAPGFSSPAEVNKALTWLEADENDFITREAHRASKRGRKSVFAVLTQKAFEYLGIKGIQGKGAFEHKLHQYLVSENLKKDGLDAKIEGRIKGSGKSIDVLVNSGAEGYVAYEITHNFSNLVSNIEDDFEAGVSRIVIVTKDDAGMTKAENIVGSANNWAQYNNSIIFQKISNFFA